MKNVFLKLSIFVAPITYNRGKKDTPATKELWSKIAFFKRIWQTLKVLPHPRASGSFLRGIRGFQKVATHSCTSRGYKVTDRQSLNNSIFHDLLYKNGVF